MATDASKVIGHFLKAGLLPKMPRPLNVEDKALLTALLKSSHLSYQDTISSSLVEDMNDGRLGSVRLIKSANTNRSIGAVLAEAQSAINIKVPGQ
jgi:hypothetical protein